MNRNTTETTTNNDKDDGKVNIVVIIVITVIVVICMSVLGVFLLRVQKRRKRRRLTKCGHLVADHSVELIRKRNIYVTDEHLKRNDDSINKGSLPSNYIKVAPESKHKLRKGNLETSKEHIYSEPNIALGLTTESTQLDYEYAYSASREQSEENPLYLSGNEITSSFKYKQKLRDKGMEKAADNVIYKASTTQDNYVDMSCCEHAI